MTRKQTAYVGSHAARTEVPPAQLGASYEDVRLETSDGLELEGWYVPSRNGAAVIVFRVAPARASTVGEEVSDAEGLNPEIAPRPILLIHAGSRDAGTLNPRYYRAAQEPKQIWRVPTGDHTDGIDEQPREYERRVVTFLDQALRDE